MLVEQASRDEVVGFPKTTNERLPPTIVEPETATTIANAVELVAGIVENVKVAPPSRVEGVIFEAEDDDMLKSDAMPVVDPEVPETEILQLIAFKARGKAPCMHESRDDAVGIPNTTKVTALPASGKPPYVASTRNWEVLRIGAVENVKVAPLLEVLNAETVDVDETEKSEANPEVGPLMPETAMVQITAARTREIEGLLQVSVDAVDGVPSPARLELKVRVTQFR